MSPQEHSPGAPVGGGVPDAATVAGWTALERDEVARLLAEVRSVASRPEPSLSDPASPDPSQSMPPLSDRSRPAPSKSWPGLAAPSRSVPAPRDARTLRPFVLLVGAGGAVVLLPWIAYLTATLPATTNVGAWRVAWVGYDIGLVIVLGGVAWLAYRRRQLVTIGLSVAATLVAVDVWFDVTLSWNTSGHLMSLLTAALVELPVSAFLLVAALRIRLVVSHLLCSMRQQAVKAFSL